MTEREHRKRHGELHRALDELVADWITNTKSLPSESAVMDLMSWSKRQSDKPDHRGSL